MTADDSLKFKVAPHIVEDLGLNLYTDLPRVLVEFVANAYDADSPHCRISLDFEQIDNARRTLKAVWEAERAEADARRVRAEADALAGLGDRHIEAHGPVEPLEQRTLPENITIVIEDGGHGMTRQELGEKFLVAGRRRRKEDPEGDRSRGGRVVMGRKGLGKLAGFGVAHRVEVVSRGEGEAHATKVTLDYDELVKARSTEEIRVPTETLANGGGIAGHGTRITLSRLVYDPLKSRKDTIRNQIGDYFALVDVADFVVEVNGELVTPTPKEFVFAYPNPELPVDQFVAKEHEAPDGRKYSYQYRLRFTAPKHHLRARERGIRVYAHRRLAAAPDLLDAPTGMHGFRQTDYLDGVVFADFIDEQPSEYIATDRQSLRWEVPLLEPMHEFLSQEIKRACAAYQARRDEKAKEAAEEDVFTKELISRNKLPPHKRRIAVAIAAGLINHLPEGKDSPEYRTQLEILVEGLGQGSVLQAMADLARQDSPSFDRVVAQAVELTEREISEIMRFVDGHLDAIRALKKIVDSTDFRAKKNEKELHRLFERAPWLIDPTYTQFITSDTATHTLYNRLAQDLGIGRHAPVPVDPSDETRPDLVFLLGSPNSRTLVIVELKAPNVPLRQEHLNQLKGYMARAEAYLSGKGRIDVRVEGYLIGTLPDVNSKAVGATLLRYDMQKEMANASWKVLDLSQVLERTMLAHDSLLVTYERISGVSALTEF